MTVVYGVREVRKGVGVVVWGLRLPDGRVVLWDRSRSRVEAWRWHIEATLGR